MSPSGTFCQSPKVDAGHLCAGIQTYLAEVILGTPANQDPVEAGNLCGRERSVL
jgi:hypothetical protein